MSDEKKFGKEDLQDIAKFSGDLLKKTVSSGIDVIMDLKGNIPKEAATFIANRKEELSRGLSKEVVQSVITATVDTFFSVVRQHRIELSISIRKNEPNDDSKKTTSTTKSPN